TDAEAAELASKATWNARVSCALGDDTFVISLNRGSMIVSGYAEAATIAAVETWADNQPALC
ncbi:MAG: glycerol permease, partial [Methanocorpusculum sp.]|nr:glycerol permease [Methanocorpusculum sp.]